MKRTVIGMIAVVLLAGASVYIIKSKARQATGESMSLDEAIEALAEVEGTRDAILEYNRIINGLVNEGRYAEGAAALVTFLEQAPDDLIERVHADVALCYRALGDDPALGLKEAATWYAKAHEHDPDSLDDSQLRALRAAGF